MDERDNQQSVQKEIRSELFLCDGKGRYNVEAVGWARHPLAILNLNGNFPFKKSLERWEVFSDTGYLHAVAGHFEHSAAMRVDYLDRASGRMITRSAVVRFPEARKYHLPERWTQAVEREMDGLQIRVQPEVPPSANPDDDSLVASTPTKKIAKKIKRLKDQTIGPGKLSDQLSVSAAGTELGQLDAEFVARRPVGQESLNIGAAWSRRKFAWVSRIPYPEVEGSVRIGPNVTQFAAKKSMAVRDIVRAVLPYQMSGQRAVCLARSGREFCALTAGRDWTIGSGMNENSILIDGRLYKLYDSVRFVPVDGGRIALRTLSSSAVDLLFETTHESTTLNQFLLLKLGLTRRIGTYSGEIRIGSRRIKVDGAPGVIEDFRVVG